MNTIVAEYVWIGGEGELRSKSKTLNIKNDYTIKDLPNWNYD